MTSSAADSDSTPNQKTCEHICPYLSGEVSITPESRLSEMFVELVDTLVEEFDVIDLLQDLIVGRTALAGVDTGGLLLPDQQGRLRLVAESSAGTAARRH